MPQPTLQAEIWKSSSKGSLIECVEESLRFSPQSGQGRETHFQKDYISKGMEKHATDFSVAAVERICADPAPKNEYIPIYDVKSGDVRDADENFRLRVGEPFWRRMKDNRPRRLRPQGAGEFESIP